MPLSDARAYLDAVLLLLMQITVSAALYHSTLDVQGRWRFGFHDSLIIAVALTAGCWTPLSEDLQHRRKLDSLPDIATQLVRDGGRYRRSTFH